MLLKEMRNSNPILPGGGFKMLFSIVLKTSIVPHHFYQLVPQEPFLSVALRSACDDHISARDVGLRTVKVAYQPSTLFYDHHPRSDVPSVQVPTEVRVELGLGHPRH